jgi:hypothetical protein
VGQTIAFWGLRHREILKAATAPCATLFAAIELGFQPREVLTIALAAPASMTHFTTGWLYTRTIEECWGR